MDNIPLDVIKSQCTDFPTAKSTKRCKHDRDVQVSALGVVKDLLHGVVIRNLHIVPLFLGEPGRTELDVMVEQSCRDQAIDVPDCLW